MFARLEEFLAVWRRESAVTARVLRGLTDAALEQAVAPGLRTLGDIAWHLTAAQKEIVSKTGLRYDGPTNDTPRPSTAAEIGAAYLAASAALVAALETQWTDKSLGEVGDIYGEPWRHGHTLMIMLHHEIHHRGQLTVLMRQAGLPVPSVYGPSADHP